MIGKILKTIVTLIIGMILGIAGFFGALAVGGYWTVTSLTVGQITSPFLGDQADVYLSEEAQEMKLLEAINYLTSMKTIGQIEEFLPIVKKTLTDVLEGDVISNLVSIDREKLSDVTLDSLTSMHVDELMDSLTITATIESVLEITKLNLDDLGFGFITDLSIYNNVDYEKVTNKDGDALKGDVAFERAGNGVLEGLYVKSGNTYVPYTPKGNKLDPANTYYVVKGGLNVENYLYATSPEKQVYSVNKEGVITYDTSANNYEISYKYTALKDTPVLELVPVLMHKIFEITFDDLELVCTDFLKLDTGSNIDVGMLFDALKSATPSIADRNLGYVLDNLGVFAEDLQVAKLLQAIGIYDPNSDDMISSLIGVVAFKGGNAQTIRGIIDGIFDIYAVDLIDALDLQFPELIRGAINLLCYEGCNKNGAPLTIRQIVDNVKDLMTEKSNLKLIDVFNAISPETGEVIMDLNRFRPIVEVLAYTNLENKTGKVNLSGLLDRFNNFLSLEDSDIYTIDLVNALIESNLFGSLIENFSELIDLVAYANPDNKTGKYTVGATYNVVMNATEKLKTLDVVDALIEENIMSELLQKFYSLIELVALDDNDTRLTINGTIDNAQEMFKDLMAEKSNLKIIDVFNAISPETGDVIMDLNRFRPLVEVLAYTDPKNKTGEVNFDGLLDRFNNLLKQESDINAIDVINALQDAEILDLSEMQELLDLICYDSNDKELTIGQVMDRVFGIMNEDSDITVRELLDAVKAIGIDLSNFDPLIDLVAKENGENLNVDGTINKVFNFTDLVVYDIVDALTEMGFDFAGMFSGTDIDINDVYDVLLIDAKDGTTRLKVGELIANVFNVKIGDLASAVGFDLELFGMESCGDICLNDVIIRKENNEIEKLDLDKFWAVLDIPLVFETLLQLRPSYLVEKILAKRLTVEYFAEKGLANAEGTDLAISIYDREGNRISYTISKQTDTTYFNNNGTISEITTQKHFILDANGNYIYEAYDGSDNRYCDGVRGDDLLNRINFMTISELIDGYATDAQYDILRKFLPGTTTLAELFTGEGFKTDDTDVTLADFLGEEMVNSNHIIKALAYNPNDGSKIKVSEISGRLNDLTIAEIILPMDAEGNIIGAYGEGDTKIMQDIIPANTKITEIGKINFTQVIKNLKIQDAMGLTDGESSGDKYIDILIKKGATVGNFASTLANLSLLEFAGVELFTEVTVTSSYTSDKALYTFDGNNTYTLVDGSFNVLNGEYTYTSLDISKDYYQINRGANFWHLLLTTRDDSTPNSAKDSAQYGAYDTIKVNNNLTLGDFENHNVNISTDALKIKYMIDIGITTTGTITTTNGSIVCGIYDSTIADAIKALIDKILLAG